MAEERGVRAGGNECDKRAVNVTSVLIRRLWFIDKLRADQKDELNMRGALKFAAALMLVF